MLVEKLVCDACGDEISVFSQRSLITGKMANGDPMFPGGNDGYGGRYYDLCGACTLSILRMFSAKEEAK